MSEDKFIAVLSNIESRMQDIWGAIDDIRKSSKKTNDKMIDILMKHTEKIAVCETQFVSIKWVAGLIGFKIFLDIAGALINN